MMFLIDTHVFLWFLNGEKPLPQKVSAIMHASDAQFVLSFASLWEMTIKAAKKQLEIPGGSLEQLLSDIEGAGLTIIQPDGQDLLELAALPFIHRDPFDRMIVAQAKRHGVTLITDDSFIQQYGVPWLWR